MYVSEFVPAVKEFTFHRYTGLDPWFVGNAEKVTWIPEQTARDVAVMLTLTGMPGVTVTA